MRPTDGCAVLDRQIHQLADLAGVGLGQRTAKDGEILCEHVDRPIVHRSVATDDAVAGNRALCHSEILAAMGHESVDLDEAARIQEQLDALPGGQFSGGVLALDSRLAAP